MLAVYESLKVRGVSLPLNLDGRDSIVDGLQIASREFHVRATKVLCKAVQLRGSRNWHDPRSLSEQPGKSNLRLSCFFLVGDAAECVHQCLVRFSVFLVEPGNDIPKIVLFKLRFFVDGPGQEAFPERTEWDEADTKFLERR